MEITCPQCGQRLRVPDELSDPLVRCRSCQSTFRPSETALRPVEGILPRPEPPVAIPPHDVFSQKSDESLDAFLEKTRSHASTSTKETSRNKAAGWGAGLLIAMIAIKGGARLVRHMAREDRKPRPVPMQHNPAQQKAIQELLEQANQQRRLPQPPPAPPLRPVPGFQQTPEENVPAEKLP